MRRKLLGLIGIVVIVGSLAYVIRPAGHIPPYDANLVRLAETPLQGYCSGQTFMRTSGAGSATEAAGCRDEKLGLLSDSVNMGAVESSFCQAVLDSGWQGDMLTCLDILRTNELWPTYDGALSAAWNRAHKYPRQILGGNTPPDNSRTGPRAGQNRVPIVRGQTASPTPTDSPSPTSTDTPSPTP